MDTKDRVTDQLEGNVDREVEKLQVKKALILVDRDGTINFCPEDKYVTNLSDFREYEGALSSIADLMRFANVGIITNQSKLSNDDYTPNLNNIAQFKLICAYITNCVRLINKIDEEVVTFYCYHHRDQMCGCRKPEYGLLYLALGYFRWDTDAEIWIIGDHYTDILLGERAGLPNIKTILVQTGRGNEKETVDFFNRHKACAPDFTVPSLIEASKLIERYYVS